jgi:hypothetical protein
MTGAFGFRPGQPPEWDIERFMRGGEVATAVTTLERNRRTFAWKCADVDADGLALRLGASSVTLGDLLKHLAWVEELYFQEHSVGRECMAPFDQLDLGRDLGDMALDHGGRGRRMPGVRSGCRPCIAPAARWRRRCPAADSSRRPRAA